MKLGISDGTELGVFQGFEVGGLLGFLTNRAFDASSPGVRLLGILVGAMDGVLPERTDGCVVG